MRPPLSSQSVSGPLAEKRPGATLRLHLAALGGYLLLSIALTWPLVAHWDSAYVAYLEEAGHNAWNIWWVGEALAHASNPFWSPLLFFPEGVPLYVQTFNLVGSLLVMPVALLFGVTAAYNTLVLLAFTLSGYGTFVLARRFAANFAIPFFCGALFAAGPFHMIQMEISHLNILSVQWLPLYLWALLRLDERPTVANAALTALLFLLNALTDWYWALNCALATAVWWLSGLLPQDGRWRRGRGYLVTGGLIGIGLLPLLLSILSLRTAGPSNGLRNDASWLAYVRGFSADALGLVLPNMLQPLWGTPLRHWLEPMISPFYSASGWYMASGWTLLLCAGMGLRRSWRQHWRWLALGGAAWLLSLGPSLHLLGYDTGLRMPYQLIEQIELLSMARKPSHFSLIALLSLVVFAALGLQWLRERLSPQRFRLILSCVAGLAVVELWPPVPYPVHPIERPAIIESIRERPGVVADLPLERTETSRALRNQMLHGQPIIGGYVSRAPSYPSFTYDPIIAQIGGMQPWPVPDIFPVDHAAMAVMQCATPVRHVLVLRSETSPTMLAGLEAALTRIAGEPLRPVASDERFLRYELPRYPEACQPYLFPGAGWGVAEHDQSQVWRWAGASNEIWLVNPSEHALSVSLELRGQSYNQARAVQLWDAETLVASWELGTALRSYSVQVALPPGRTRLRLVAPTTLDPVSGRELSISVQAMRLVINH